MTRWGFTSAIASALFAVVAFTQVASAFDTDEQKCRDTIANQGIKLATTATKTFVSCHKKRVAGGIAPSVNCNLVAEADPSSKIPKAAQKLVDKAVDKCTGFVPADLLYEECPVPCNAQVPTITDFQDVADCVVCVAQFDAEQLSFNGQGSPGLPLDLGQAKCHGSIGKNQDKHFKTLLKERRKCQKSAEKAGATDTSSCAGNDPKGKIGKAKTKGETKIAADCTGVTLSALDTCGEESILDLNSCVFSTSAFLGEEVFQAVYNLLPGGVTTTTTVNSTTTTVTTSTTMGGGGQDPQCPNKAELILFAGTTGLTCATNGDCEVGTCNVGLGRCQTVSQLDTGWTGISHDADIVDQVLTRVDLQCPGPSPVCGECTVTGIDPSTRGCRCATDNRQICDEPFQADADDCGGDQCNCYFGVPLPLSAGNTPACVVNRFRSDITGTANIDLGEGASQVRLASVVYTGISTVEPCPSCGGTCTAGKVGTACSTDLACDNALGDGSGVCGNFDPVPDDGIRGGVCVKGLNAGASCDAGARHESFTAPGGAAHSLDCFPDVGKNVSGTGLVINLDQTTGTSSLPEAAISCPFFGIPDECHCGLCTGNLSVTCTGNADCAAVGAGNCAAVGSGEPQNNSCVDDVCTDVGDGEGVCMANSPDKSCDGIVRASGAGFLQCNSQADCDAFPNGIAGNCSLTKDRSCFLPTVSATGTPDPQYPIAVGTFCIAKTGNPGINSVAGLPGPAKAINQGKATYFCASDPGTTYVPGVGGCP